MDSIDNIILRLENDLLKSEVRKSSKKIAEILDTDFIEFCSSGTEYYYKIGDVFQIDDDKELDWTIQNLKTKELSQDCLLATYTLTKNDECDETKKYSLRSSIWKNYQGKWKIIFHQGTLCDKSNRRMK